MIQLAISLVNWNYGILLISSFAVVVIGLVLIVFSLMKNDKKKNS
ncbi:hypothetical protein [Cellulophaga sp. HaHaR_3_176]|nr:hypothetical protein [Cellulophaga sp. HaHaR_3_176]